MVRFGLVLRFPMTLIDNPSPFYNFDPIASLGGIPLSSKASNIWFRAGLGHQSGNTQTSKRALTLETTSSFL